MIGSPRRSQSPASAAATHRWGEARQLETDNSLLLAIVVERDLLGWSARLAAAARVR